MAPKVVLMVSMLVEWLLACRKLVLPKQSSATLPPSRGPFGPGKSDFWLPLVAVSSLRLAQIRRKVLMIFLLQSVKALASKERLRFHMENVKSICRSVQSSPQDFVGV